MEFQELDIRPVTPRERHPKIFSTFDALQQGEGFQLINDHEPRPLFYQFEHERPGQFHWEYKEKGPELWRVDITKI